MIPETLAAILYAALLLALAGIGVIVLVASAVITIALRATDACYGGLRRVRRPVW